MTTTAQAPAPIQAADKVEKIGLYLTGQVMLPPRYFAASVDKVTGEKRPDQFSVTLFYGAKDMATFYLRPTVAAGLQQGDVVTVGPLRTGRNGALYMNETEPR